MKFLIVYASTEGQTRKISQFMKDSLEEKGHLVTIADAALEPPAPKGFDAIMIGASVHLGKYQSAIRRYITKHVQNLNSMPAAFYSVCLAIASAREQEHLEAKKITDNFLKLAGWTPLMIRQIAGALKYTKYSFFTRLLMKWIAKKEGHSTDSSRDYEYTDWSVVETFADEFALRANEMILLRSREKSFQQPSTR